MVGYLLLKQPQLYLLIFPAIVFDLMFAFSFAVLHAVSWHNFYVCLPLGMIFVFLTGWFRFCCHFLLCWSFFVHSCFQAVLLACDFRVYFHFCCYRCPNTRLAEKRKWVTPCRNIGTLPLHLTGSFNNIITQSILHLTTPKKCHMRPLHLTATRTSM